MSTYEEERGTLILPAQAIPTFRKTIVNGLNAERQRIFDAAQRLYEYVNQPDPAQEGERAKRSRLKPIRDALKNGKNNYQKREQVKQALYRAFDAIDGKIDYNYMSRSYHQYSNDVRHEAVKILCPYNEQKVELKVPKKKDYPLLPMSTTSFQCSDASLTINQEERTVEWYVDRNNHAVDHAWESVLGQSFEKALSEITWTRGTGGSFRKTDEYAEDAAMEHGYSPITISRSFGPRGDRQYEDETGIKRRGSKLSFR